jgi:hypothetical protein
MFVSVLIAFLCMLTNKQVGGQIWVKGDQNWGFGMKNGWVPKRKPKNWVHLSGATR